MCVIYELTIIKQTPCCRKMGSRLSLKKLQNVAGFSFAKLTLGQHIQDNAQFLLKVASSVY